MADDKKSDDYKIDMPAGKEFRAPSPVARPAPRQVSLTENPMLSIFAYCGSSILMTTTNKYVLSGVDYNLNFFLLAVQVRSDTSPFWWTRGADEDIGHRLRCCHLNLQERRSHYL
jgi:hypothetical protein